LRLEAGGLRLGIGNLELRTEDVEQAPCLLVSNLGNWELETGNLKLETG